MATLTNTKIKDTYVGLLKTTDNQAIDASGVTLVEDGAGNASALSVGRSGNGVSVSGTIESTGYFSVEGTSGNTGGASDRWIGGDGTLGTWFYNVPTGSSHLFGVNNSNILTLNGSGASITGNLAVDTNTLYVDAANNRVGVGTLSPTHKVEILGGNASTLLLNNDGSQFTQLLFENNGSSNSGVDFLLDNTNSTFSLRSLKANQPIIFSTSTTSGAPTERMRIDSSGNVGIGTIPVSIASYTTLDIRNASSGSILYLGKSGTDSLRLVGDATNAYIQNRTATGSLIFGTNNGVERMRITSTGQLLINTTSLPNGTVAGAGFTPNTNGRTTLHTGTDITTSSNLIYFYNPNGLVGSISTSGSSTIYATSSDYRLKENVVEMTGALDRVDALKPSRFNFIADPNTTVDGFLAHEVAEVVPEAISGEKDAVDEEGNPIYQGIDQSKIVPLLVGAIKELRAEIELLKAK